MLGAKTNSVRKMHDYKTYTLGYVVENMDYWLYFGSCVIFWLYFIYLYSPASLEAGKKIEEQSREKGGGSRSHHRNGHIILYIPIVIVIIIFDILLSTNLPTTL